MFPPYRNQLVCRANQLTGFYMVGTMIVKGLDSFNNRNGIPRRFLDPSRAVFSTQSNISDGAFLRK